MKNKIWLIVFTFIITVVITGCGSSTDTADDNDKTATTPISQEEQTEPKIVKNGEFAATGQEAVDMLEQALKINYDENVSLVETENGPGFYRINDNQFPVININLDNVWIESPEDVANGYIIGMEKGDEIGIQLSSALYYLTTKDNISFEEAYLMIQEKQQNYDNTGEYQDWSEENIHFSFDGDETEDGAQRYSFSVWYWE